MSGQSPIWPDNGLTFINFDQTTDFQWCFFAGRPLADTPDQLSRQLVDGFGVQTLLLVKFNFVQTHAIIDRKMSGYWMLSWALSVASTLQLWYSVVAIWQHISPLYISLGTRVSATSQSAKCFVYRPFLWFWEGGVPQGVVWIALKCHAWSRDPLSVLLAKPLGWRVRESVL